MFGVMSTLSLNRCESKGRNDPNLIKNLEVTHPNQVWCGDITFIPLANGKTAYLAVLIDIFTRMIQGWSLERDMSVKLINQALDKALAKGISPEIHHSDHGGQYVAQSYCDRLIALDCQISMAGKGKPWETLTLKVSSDI